MSNLINTFQERWSEWLIALLEHLEISIVAILISIMIAVPFAIIVMRYSKVKEWILQLTGIFQTIPSLALLGLFIPFLGIGKLPAVIALIIYAIFPILQNTVTGFEQIDRDLEEAGEAFGMTFKEKLLTYQLPLALPVIIAGIRTTTVMVIGTATLAALIGAGGLGSFILLGIDRNNSALIFIGAISSALLAVIFNYLLNLVSKFSLKHVGLVFLTVSILTTISFSMNHLNYSKERHLVIAGKLGPEPEILMNMYKILIEENSDISIEVKPNFGKTSFLYEALKSGEIDIYPEFTGTIISSLLQKPLQVSNDPQEVFEIAKEKIYEQDKLVLLSPMKYQNTYAIAVTDEFSKKYNIEKISDLKKVESFAKAGFSLEFNDREDGVKGLKSIYGLNLSISTLEPSLRYSAIQNGDIQIIEVYSTDSEIKQYGLKLLKDDKKLFPPYQGAPLIKEETLKKYPEIETILNQLAGKITEEEMAEMNYKVKIENHSAFDVAKMYLERKNFIK